ncbi:MAG: transglutaminase domain-containing protein [Myxococcota bacterium]
MTAARLRGARLGLGALVLVLAIAAEGRAAGFDPFADAARYEFRYQVDLSKIESEADEEIRLWLPLPAKTPDQQVLEEELASSIPYTETVDALGNRMVHLRWTGRAAEGARFELRTVVSRRPSRGLARDAAKPGSPDDPARHLAPTRKIPLDGLIAQLGAQESRGLDTDRARIRSFYDYVVRNLRYAKHGDGWGQGDAIWACTEKYGNCTDFHSLFLGMARSQGISARFHIGFPIPANQMAGEIGGYHCWADAWDPAYGWLPFDASEAWKAKRFDAYFGTLPSDRIGFTTGRDLVLEPAQAGPPLNYFVYPYAERSGVPVEKVSAHFSFQRLGVASARGPAATDARPTP